MATPKNPAPATTLIRSTAVRNRGDSIFRLVPAAVASVVVHVLLIASLIFLLDSPDAKADLEAANSASRSLNTLDKRNLRAIEKKKDLNLDKLGSVIENPLAKEIDYDPVPKEGVKADKLVEASGIVNPLEPPGKVDGSKEIALTSIPKSYGVPLPPKVGSLDNMLPGGPPTMSEGAVGLPKGTDLTAFSTYAGGSYGRSDATTRDALVKAGGGSPASEVAVNLGLMFLKRMQKENGSWKLDDDEYGSTGKGQANDIAGTALGMLPFLGRGVTIEPTINGEKNKYADTVHKAVHFLASKQDKKTGSLANGYTHAIATLALSELYSMIKDPKLKKEVEPIARKAVKYLIDSQSPDGGWRYNYREAQGDLSVSGWVIMALKSADVAELGVPKGVMEKARNYVESVVEPNTEGYRYIVGQGATPRMSVVGMLCRQYLDGWNASNIRLIKGVENYILKIEADKAKFKMHPAQAKDIYFYYYATQVVHHFGEDYWPVWNEAMRDQLIKTQYKEVVKGQEKLEGSWDPTGDPWGAAGGRLMYTSLALLTLEVYYRHLPLYYKDLVSGK